MRVKQVANTKRQSKGQVASLRQPAEDIAQMRKKMLTVQQELEGINKDLPMR